MAPAPPSRLPELVAKHASDIVARWLAQQKSSTTMRVDLIGTSELEEQSRRFIDVFRAGLASGDLDELASPAWADVHNFLRDLSRARAMQGFKATETASFIFSLKQPLFDLLRGELGSDTAAPRRGNMARLGAPRRARASTPPRSTRRAARRSSSASSRRCWSCRRRSCSCGTGSWRCR